MAALETRLLLLGAVSLFEPVNGYQLRRELLTWQVDQWANIAPGSIYNGLTTLTRRGELVRHNLRDHSREVAVYEVTDRGRIVFATLFETAIVTVTPTYPIAFYTALAFLPLVTRERARTLLLARIERLDAMRAAYDDRTAAGDGGSAPEQVMPPHVGAMMSLWSNHGQVEYEWLTRLAFRIGDGALQFADEESTWAPPDDDPGWQIVEDRKRYLHLLGRD